MSAWRWFSISLLAPSLWVPTTHFPCWTEPLPLAEATHRHSRRFPAIQIVESPTFLRQNWGTSSGFQDCSWLDPRILGSVPARYREFCCHMSIQPISGPWTHRNQRQHWRIRSFQMLHHDLPLAPPKQILKAELQFKTSGKMMTIIK